MIGQKEWVLTANATECRIFEHAKRFAPLEPVQDLEWPEGRLHARDLYADKPGRAFDSAGQGRHALEPPTDPHVEELERFAREIARVLEDGQQRGAYQRLIIIAAPRLLGMLREVLPDAVRERLQAEIDKDLTAYDGRELTEWLRRELWEKG